MPWPELTAELSRYVYPLAHFDGLTLPARDPAGVADFWRHTIPGTVHEQNGTVRIDPHSGRAKAEILRLTRTPTLPADPDRVHLDIRLAGPDPAPLLAAGASVISAPPGAFLPATVSAFSAPEDPWWVLADPEGNRFCAYPAVDHRPAGVFQLVVKCRRPVALAHWWARILGGQIEHEGEATVVTGAPDFPWDFMVFDPVPEPRNGPNRLRWHLILRDPDPGILVRGGATVLRRPASDGPAWLLADPEGNAFHATPAP